MTLFEMQYVAGCVPMLIDPRCGIGNLTDSEVFSHLYISCSPLVKHADKVILLFMAGLFPRKELNDITFRVSEIDKGQ